MVGGLALPQTQERNMNIREINAYFIGVFTGAALVAGGIGAALAQQPALPLDYTLTFNGQEWSIIVDALSDKPFRQANPILSKINQQISVIVAQRQKEAEDRAKVEAEKAIPRR